MVILFALILFGVFSPGVCRAEIIYTPTNLVVHGDVPIDVAQMTGRSHERGAGIVSRVQTVVSSGLDRLGVEVEYSLVPRDNGQLEGAGCGDNRSISGVTVCPVQRYVGKPDVRCDVQNLHARKPSQPSEKLRGSCSDA